MAGHVSDTVIVALAALADLVALAALGARRARRRSAEGRLEQRFEEAAAEARRWAAAARIADARAAELAELAVEQWLDALDIAMGTGLA